MRAFLLLQIVTTTKYHKKYAETSMNKTYFMCLNHSESKNLFQFLSSAVIIFCIQFLLTVPIKQSFSRQKNIKREIAAY